MLTLSVFLEEIGRNNLESRGSKSDYPRYGKLPALAKSIPAFKPYLYLHWGSREGPRLRKYKTYLDLPGRNVCVCKCWGRDPSLFIEAKRKIVELNHSS